MNRIVKIAVVFALVAVVATGSLAFAKKTNPGACRPDLICPDIFDPVICADGLIYSNFCQAQRECAPTPCVAYDWEI